MFGSKRARSCASSEPRPRKVRRDGRGLGPFTSGHLTIIIVTLLIMVAFPFAAFAVTGNNVFVTDATSGTHAKVDSGGHLLVGDGGGLLTVHGTIDDRAALPTKPIVITPTLASPFQPGATIYGPVSRPFAIGSVTLSNICGDLQRFWLFSSTGPVGGDAIIEDLLVPAFQTVNVTFPIPLVTSPPASGTAALKASASAPICVYVSGVGYQS
jgi:hypothetical protein